MPRRISIHTLVTIGLALATTPGAAGEKGAIRFHTDIQPILTKAGCNQGACHGSQYGKGGFKLSLRGFDDPSDYYEIVKSAEGRRVLVADAKASLLLAKPTLDVPHKGGKRLEADSWAAETLAKWIEQGAPGPSPKDIRLTDLRIEPTEIRLAPGEEFGIDVVAAYSDGSQEHVGHKACFDSLNTGIAEVTPDGLVTAKGKGETAIMVRYLEKAVICRVLIPYGASEGLDRFPIRNFIDQHWVAKWRKLGLSPAKDCTDTEFFRRIHLDTLGTLPSPKAVRSFLADTRPDKRDRAIDAVLERPEYVDYWAYKWGDLLRCNRDSLGEKGMWSFHNWLRASFRENKPMDVFARDLITAVGSPNQHGPANYFQVGRSPVDWAENTSQVFLGVRMQCAKCHHHPFENISQADYYSMAAFFARVGTKASQEFGIYGRDTVIFVRDGGETYHPRTGALMKPAPPGSQPIDDPVDRRRALAAWMTDPKNLALARNLANRYWGYYLGRGIIHPIDDVRVTNPAACEEVLDALAKHLIENRYDIKKLLKAIMQSHVYQLSSEASPSGQHDPDNRYFTHYTVKRMTAEQLLDAIDFACGTKEKFNQLPSTFRAISLPDSNVASRFLDSFGRPRREMSCECERSDTPNMTQALEFMTGNLLHRKVSAGEGRIAGMIKSKLELPKAIEEIYLHTVSRLPTREEADTALSLVKTAPTPKEGLEDLLWTMLNTREFQFNH